MKPSDCPSQSRLFTLGHGLLELDQLRALLKRYGVDSVVDVRSQPFSARVRHFNKDALAGALRSAGISYDWNPALGGRPPEHLLTSEGKPDYERMVAQPATAAALDRLASEAAERTIAILCSESRPEECHRSRMLEPELEKRGVWVEHILHSGEVAVRPTLFA